MILEVPRMGFMTVKNGMLEMALGTQERESIEHSLLLVIIPNRQQMQASGSSNIGHSSIQKGGLTVTTDMR